MNYSLTKLRNACEALMVHEEYSDVSCLAVLKWTTMPEHSKELRSIVSDSYRITEYKVGLIRVVDIYPYGKFQII